MVADEEQCGSCDSRQQTTMTAALAEELEALQVSSRLAGLPVEILERIGEHYFRGFQIVAVDFTRRERRALWHRFVNMGPPFTTRLKWNHSPGPLALVLVNRQARDVFGPQMQALVTRIFVEPRDPSPARKSLAVCSLGFTAALARRIVTIDTDSWTAVARLHHIYPQYRPHLSNLRAVRTRVQKHLDDGEYQLRASRIMGIKELGDAYLLGRILEQTISPTASVGNNAFFQRAVGREQWFRLEVSASLISRQLDEDGDTQRLDVTVHGRRWTLQQVTPTVILPPQPRPFTIADLKVQGEVILSSEFEDAISHWQDHHEITEDFLRLFGLAGRGAAFQQEQNMYNNSNASYQLLLPELNE
jgi:hypothetical protein